MGVLPVCMSEQNVCECGARRGLKKMLDLMELELQKVVSFCVGAGD